MARELILKAAGMAPLGMAVVCMLSFSLNLQGATSESGCAGQPFGAALEGLEQPARPTFRASVELVTLSAVVRDKNGRLITSLSKQDFELIDAGRHRPITEFRAEESPLSVALLIDESGSMSVGSKKADARDAGHHLLSWLRAEKDEAALFSFDSSLRERHSFTTSFGEIQREIDRSEPYGATSLHDAIAETARRVVQRGRSRRAVVVLTDGVDTSSRLTASEVSGIASSIDVPVYIVAVVSPVDHPDGSDGAVPSRGAVKVPVSGSLTDLARWTGGELLVVSAPAHASSAARQIVSELRHQYLIAFEPSGTPGWHPLVVRTRDKDLTVRARSGYMAGQSRPVS